MVMRLCRFPTAAKKCTTHRKTVSYEIEIYFQLGYTPACGRSLLAFTSRTDISEVDLKESC
jgi:hypothetical protein